MNVVVAPVSSNNAIGRRIRVMIVDDAVVVRGLFGRWVEAEPDLEVVASLRTGREAVNQVERADPDVVVLDVDMPELDGLAALPLLLEKRRDLVVIMASTLTRRNAEISLKALSLGATDYIPKPASNREVTGSPSFRRDLIEKIRQLGLRSKRLRPGNLYARVPGAGAAPALPPKLRAPAAQPIALRPLPATAPRVLVIGSSTGGPQALNAIVTQIGSVLDRAPVLITQHMPSTFTTILAEHLARLTKRPAREAVEGEEVNGGTIYLAPGGRHMSVVRRDGIAVIALDDGPLVNFCKPAVDPLFSSAAEVWGPKVLALVLTGMGSDGLRGAQAIAAAGGCILAQDEPTSVVWGMPGQVAHAGLCSAVLPLDEIAPRLTRLFAGDKA
ncbi:MAG TPA: chemotaxis response regulator protein-glutamate methylesterase [Pseudolabrys sp.]|nr:chemotaxis response regulator protein-glutamate methylesterase [Pseudolabrys sp.]